MKSNSLSNCSSCISVRQVFQLWHRPVPFLYVKCNLKFLFVGGGYAIFAGKEVARALGIMSLKEEDCSADLSGLSEKQLHTLHEWEEKFKTKYSIVGKVSQSSPVV